MTGYYYRRFRFCTLAGVEGVRLEGNHIVGRWKKKLDLFSGPRRGSLVEEYVNVPPNNSQAILRFTQRYGPVGVDPQPGQTFRLPLDGWSANQEVFRHNWRTKETWGVGRTEKGWVEWVQVGDALLICHVRNLYQFLYLDLATAPHEYLKVCKRKGCLRPYFIPNHKGKDYCSEPCAAAAQKLWKKRWWDTRGKEQRALRSRAVRQQKSKESKRRKK